MKNVINYYVRSSLLFYGLLATLYSCSVEEIKQEQNFLEAVSAKATVSINWDGNSNTFATALTDAVRRAGDGGTVTLPDRTYRTDRQVLLPAINNVTITGSNRDQVRIEATQSFNAAGLINCNGNNTVFRNITVDWRGFNNASAAVNTNGFSGCKAFGMRFKRAGYGFGTPDNGSGLPIDNLVVQNSLFEDCQRGIAFVRYFNNRQVRKINKVIIRDCQFLGKQIVGISIDAGNDGADGRVNLRNLPRALEAQRTVLDMNDMEISRCFFQKSKNFNLAFAKVKNIQVFGNTFEGTTGETEFSEAINIEHESNNISINGNKITNFAQGNHNYISVITFRDYGNASIHENGCRRIFINNNTFQGSSNSGIVGEEAENITIHDNVFSFPKPAGNQDISFFRSDLGNRNITTINNTNVNPDRINIVTF